MTAVKEESRRYVRDEPTFYIPKANEWRSIPEGSMKQGSGEPVSEYLGGAWTDDLLEYVDKGVYMDEEAIKQGIAPVQARLFLPAKGIYVRYYWTASMQSVAHLINQRTVDDAQDEFRLYDEAVRALAEARFPVSLRELTKERTV